MPKPKTEPKAAAPETEVRPEKIDSSAGRVRWMVPTDRIDVVERLRPVSLPRALALAGHIAEHGQRTAIEVCRLPGQSNFRLVTGAHRIEAIRLNGEEMIWAVLVDSNDLDRKMGEISENLFRADLTVIEHAKFVAEFVNLAKSKAGLNADQDGRSISAKIRWSQGDAVDLGELGAEAGDANLNIGFAYGWAAEVAEKVGLCRASIYNCLLIDRVLQPDVVELLRGHPLENNAAQLRALTRLDPAQQRPVVEKVISGAAKNVSDGVAQVQGRAPRDEDKKAWSAFVGGWSRMSRHTQRLALTHLASDPSLPADLKALLSPLIQGQVENAERTRLDRRPDRRGDRASVLPRQSAGGPSPGSGGPDDGGRLRAKPSRGGAPARLGAGDAEATAADRIDAAAPVEGDGA